MTMSFVILFAVSIWAGIQNALAGGGTFLMLPALMFTGMTALSANITSTVALFPGQVTGGWIGRRQGPANQLSCDGAVIHPIGCRGRAQRPDRRAYRGGDERA